MQRKAIEKLKEWKRSKGRKPLIIQGARQVGKTWLMQHFAQMEFPNAAYINFEANSRMQQLFEGELTLERIIQGLQIETGTRIDENTLIIFDEVQEVPRALTAMKYFSESAKHYFLIAAGSMLGIALHEGSSFPVGKVEFLDLYPLDFPEFLLASGNEKLHSLLASHDRQLRSVFKDRFIELLRLYYFIGGMPEAVNTYVKTGDLTQVRKVQEDLLTAYEQDFSKHAPNNPVPRIREIWHAIPAQLAKENRKFIFGLLRQGARAKEYEIALQWLADSGLIQQVQRVTKPDVPLSAYSERSAFKLFLLDVGLLGALSGLDVRTLIQGNQVFEEFKGALTEQFVFQQISSTGKFEPFYWSADNNQAKIDFLVQESGNVIPVEVKAEVNLKAKSLRVYQQKFQPVISLRLSLADFRDEGWLINVPLYEINQVEQIVRVALDMRT